jgi:hypothetical protein
LFNLHFLNESGTLSRDKLIDKIKTVLNPKEYNENNNYAGKHYRNAVAKIVIQAIGRLNRTNHKNKTILILADEEIKKSLEYFSHEKMIYVKEFEKLLSVCQPNGANVNKQEEAQEFDNKRENINNYCHSYIQRMLGVINSTWQNLEDIKEWKELRKFVLKYPTLSKQELEKCDWEKVFISLKEQSNILYYTQKDDYKIVELVPSSNSSVSDKDLKQLMQLSELQTYFIQKAYATHFIKNDYILAPIIFNNIYKGVLGEIIGKCILTNRGIQLKELPDAIFEKFDYVNEAGDVFIDFKFWNENYFVDRDNAVNKIINKIQQVEAKGFNVKKVLVINIMADANAENERNIMPFKENRIITIRYLIKKQPFVVCEDTLYKIAGLINGN